jgi:hypothetical protein
LQKKVALGVEKAQEKMNKKQAIKAVKSVLKKAKEPAQAEEDSAA